ncbi:MAG: hypothetical protein PHV74_07305 [Dehalococcoidia bacterium]|nr:hypothetical protein [Dehalococcoidia bacterium]
MSSDIDEITISYEEEGQLVVKELGKEILSKGAWATIIFRYRQWERAKNGYGPDRFSIRRYRKMNDEYRQQAKFNISSRDQASKIVGALQKWLQEPAEADESGESDE